MKTPEYHNPQQVPESALNKSLGERFLLREEVGADHVDRKCFRWYPMSNEWISIPSLGINSNITYKTTLPLPPEYRDEIDWKTPDKQAEVRRMWAENPAMERECKSKHGRDEWALIAPGETWRGAEYFYRPAQKPREFTQEELDEEAYRQTCTKDCDPLSVWKYACEYAREASGKEVA